MTSITVVPAIWASFTMNPVALLIAVPFGVVTLLRWVYYAWPTELIDELWITGGRVLVVLVSLRFTMGRGT